MFERLSRLNLKELVDKPIPEIPAVDGWKGVPIKECGEPLVPLGIFSKYRQIPTASIYFGEGTFSPYQTSPLEGGLITVFVREFVAKALTNAQRLLPERHHLVAFDGYRPLEVQQSLFDQYYQYLEKSYPDWDKKQLMDKTQEFVSLPSSDPKKPSPHNTGGSVDLVIVSVPTNVEEDIKEADYEIRRAERHRNWQEAYLAEMRRHHLIRMFGEQLDFGTPFDYGQDEAYIEHFEKISQIRQLTDKEIQQRSNRRILYHVMTHPNVGFQPYPFEWWHFNYGNQMAAKSKGESFAMYGAAILGDTQLEHEQMRRGHFLGCNRIFAGWRRPDLKVDAYEEHFRIASKGVELYGDLATSKLPRADAISP